MLNIKVNYANSIQRSTLPSFEGLNKVTENNNLTTWFNVIDCQDSVELFTVYRHICKASPDTKKWILMINPENNTLQKLAHLNKIDHSKILKINAHKVKVDVENVNKALRKGNCSTIVICDPMLTSTEIQALQQSAIIGKTQCVILKTQPTIH